MARAAEDRDRIFDTAGRANSTRRLNVTAKVGNRLCDVGRSSARPYSEPNRWRDLGRWRLIDVPPPLRVPDGHQAVGIEVQDLLCLFRRLALDDFLIKLPGPIFRASL